MICPEKAARINQSKATRALHTMSINKKDSWRNSTKLSIHRPGAAWEKVEKVDLVFQHHTIATKGA